MLVTSSLNSLTKFREASAKLRSAGGQTAEMLGIFWQMASALEILLADIARAARANIGERPTLGRYIASLSTAGIFPGSLKDKLYLVAQTRNMAAHSVDSRIEEKTLIQMGETIKEVFSWYLTEASIGPHFPKKVAKSIMESDSSDTETVPTPKKVFICYGSEDYTRVEELYHRLQQRGHKPWMDKKSLLPGQKWEEEIGARIRKSDAFIACLSRKSVSKRGYVQKEMRYALDVLGEIPQGHIFLIPLRLEPCEVPDHLSFLHWLDLKDEKDYEKLFEAIEIQKMQ